MNFFEALILGLIQGLTEFLPISSSGHLEIGKALLGIEPTDSLIFSVVVHGATVLSTIVVFRNDIADLFKGLLKFKYNTETQYVAKILLSMLPVLIIGVFFKDIVENFFNGHIAFVGAMLLITALLLAFSHFAKKRQHNITYTRALIIGIAQAIATLPGISRSGATIATGLLLGIKKEHVARFSFLMVLIPIIGANLLELIDGQFTANANMPASALIIGFVAAFLSGLAACTIMINIVKKGKLIYFAIYCALVGSIAIIFN